MEITVNQWGNSQGIRIPKTLLKKLGADIGTILDANFKDGKVVIEKVKKKKEYDIKDLVKKIESNKPIEVDWGQPKGMEVW